MIQWYRKWISFIEAALVNRYLRSSALIFRLQIISLMYIGFKETNRMRHSICALRSITALFSASPVSFELH